MADLVNVVFYCGMGKRDHILDLLTQDDPPSHWVPAIANFSQNRNLDRLMMMANISPEDWRQHLIAKYQFDPAAPAPQGLLKAGVPIDRLDAAMASALERTDEWEDPDTYLWGYDADLPANLSPEHVEDVIRESRGRGTPVIAFRADADKLEAALSDDNQITIIGEKGVYIGLSDPVNGYGWSPENLNGPVSFRPSIDGQIYLVDEHPIFEHVVDDAYTADIKHVLGEPLRYTTASDAVMRFGPPKVVDMRALNRRLGV